MDDCKYFGAIEGGYVDSWSYTITKSEGWVKEKSYGPELICQGDFNFSYQYKEYPYLENGNPFSILNANFPFNNDKAISPKILFLQPVNTFIFFF